MTSQRGLGQVGALTCAPDVVDFPSVGHVEVKQDGGWSACQ